jgi:putative restriction endonuclease
VANSVFIAKLDSGFDDAVEVRYHFPNKYLSRVEKSIGDWIIYYESKRDGGRMVYFAMARVLSVEPDKVQPDHYYALMTDYVEFPEPVPFRVNGVLVESFVRNPDGSTNPGAAINSVRELPRAEFEHICRLGMAPALEDTKNAPEEAVAETQSEYGGPRPSVLTARPLRDAAFSRIVRKAYNRTCAMTGLQLVNGGGRCEIEAAHIRPVENDGPDSPRNGLALSRTVHWLFDRGFLSLEDNGTILQATKLVPDPVKRLLNPEGKIHLPSDRNSAPHSVFLRWHRDNKFKC